MKMKLKKIMVSFAAVCILSTMAAGCGSSESAAETEGAQETQTDDVLPEEQYQPEAAEENTESDPIVGIVEQYEDNTIIIKDPGDEMLYYFSTQNAQIVEGDSPITVGDKVAVTYQGLLGDEEHPGEAMKVTADTAN